LLLGRDINPQTVPDLRSGILQSVEGDRQAWARGEALGEVGVREDWYASADQVLEQLPVCGQWSVFKYEQTASEVPATLCAESTPHDVAQLGTLIDWLVRLSQQSGEPIRREVVQEVLLVCFTSRVVSVDIEEESSEAFIGEETPEPQDLRATLDFLYDCLRDGELQNHLNPHHPYDNLRILLGSIHRLHRLICLNAPDCLMLGDIRILSGRLMSCLKPEAALAFTRVRYAPLVQSIERHPALAPFAAQAKKIACLIEMSCYQKSAVRFESITTMSHLFGLCLPEHQPALADALLEVINKTPAEEVSRLIEFMGCVEEDVVGEATVIVNLNTILRKVTGRRVLAIQNVVFLQEVIRRTHGCVQRQQGLMKDPDSELSSGFEQLEDPLSLLDGLRQILSYHPTPEVLRAMMTADAQSGTQNHLIWVLKNIPKGSQTRDARRFLADYLLLRTRLKLFLARAQRGDWTDDNIGKLRELYAWEHDPALRGEIRTPEDAASDRDLIAEMKDEVALLGYDDYKQFRDYGFDVTLPLETVAKLQEIDSFFDDMLISINRTQTDSAKRAETMLAFIEFCRVVTNLGNLLPGLAFGEIIEGMRAQCAQKRRREFMDAAEIKKITETIKLAALDDFFAKSSLPADTQSKIREQMQNPESPLSEPELINEIVAYYHFQGPGGREAVNEYLRMIANQGRHVARKGVLPVEREVTLMRRQTSRREGFLTVYRSILEHLMVEGSAEIAEADLRTVIMDVEVCLRDGRRISHDKLFEWQQRLQECMSQQPNGQITEVLHDLEQIRTLQENRNQAPGTTYDFFITDDPVVIARAGEEPLRTCQRISSPGAYNREGQPLWRAMHPHVSLAGLKDPHTGKVVARVLLEYVRPGIMLVERHYLAGGISMEEFDYALLSELARQRRLRHVVFADNRGLPFTAETVLVGEIPEYFYHDTFYSHAEFRAIRLDDKDTRMALQTHGVLFMRPVKKRKKITG